MLALASAGVLVALLEIGDGGWPVPATVIALCAGVAALALSFLPRGRCLALTASSVFLVAPLLGLALKLALIAFSGGSD